MKKKVSVHAVCKWLYFAPSGLKEFVCFVTQGVQAVSQLKKQAIYKISTVIY